MKRGEEKRAEVRRSRRGEVKREEVRRGVDKCGEVRRGEVRSGVERTLLLTWTSQQHPADVGSAAPITPHFVSLTHTHSLIGTVYVTYL